MKIARNALLAGALALSACTAAQVAEFQGKVSTTAGQALPELTAACANLVSLANIAGAVVPGAGAITTYVYPACVGAEGLTRLAADPTSLEWLGKLNGQLRGLAQAAGIRLPE